MVAGMAATLFAARYDNPKPTPAFHNTVWDFCCSDYKYVAIAAPRGHAKAQSLDSRVLTPSGWVRFGDLDVGSEVISGNGAVTSVVGMSPVTEMDLYRVTTRDGRSALCNLDHLWDVEVPSNQPGVNQTLTLEQIREIYKTPRFDKRYNKEHTEYRVRLHNPSPVQFLEKDLPIDPYTLGIWLGDGSKSSGRIYTGDEEVLDYIPYEITDHETGINYGVVGLTAKLREAGVLDNKHIPDAYFTGSIEQRLALLQGLMDSDGTCHHDHGQTVFANTNYSLIQGVVALVRSLGGSAQVCTGRAMFCGKDCGPAWRVTVKIGLCPFRLKRKAERWSCAENLFSYIVSIEKEVTGLGRCIKVADPSQTYITDDYMKTHNTTSVTGSYLMANILARRHKFILVISDTESQAADFLGEIKNEFNLNDPLREMFSFDKFERDSTTDIVLRFADGWRCRIIAKGSEQKLRGMKWFGSRPSLVVCHEKDTLIEADGEEMLNTDHPTAKTWAADGYQVVADGHAERVSADHMYWVKTSVDAEPKWVQARDLKPGMFIGDEIQPDQSAVRQAESSVEVRHVKAWTVLGMYMRLWVFYTSCVVCLGRWKHSLMRVFGKGSKGERDGTSKEVRDDEGGEIRTA